MPTIYDRPLYGTPSSTGSSKPRVVPMPQPRTGPAVPNSGGIPNPTNPSAATFVAPPGVNNGPVGRPPTTGQAPAAGSFFLGGPGGDGPSIFDSPGGDVPPTTTPVAPQPPPTNATTAPPATTAPVPGAVAAGPMKGRHYDPAIDGPDFEAFQARQRQFRDQFAQGGAIDKRQQGQEWVALDFLQKHPHATKEQFRQYLMANTDLRPEHEQGEARLKALEMMFDGTINGNYHYDLATGRKYNVGTSDQNRDWEQMTPEEIADAQKTPAQRFADMLGIGQFQGRNNKKGHIPELQWDPTKKAWFDQDPEGRVYYDAEGWVLDANGRRVGGAQHYYNPNHQQVHSPNPAATPPAATPPAGAPAATPPATTPAPGTTPVVPQPHQPGTGGVTPTATATPVPTPMAAAAQQVTGQTTLPGAEPIAPPPSTQPVVAPGTAAPAPTIAAGEPNPTTAPAPTPNPGLVAPAAAGQPTAVAGSAFLPGQGPGVQAASGNVPGSVGSPVLAPPAPPPAPVTKETVASVPPGGTLATEYGQISRTPEGKLQMILSAAGAEIHNRTVQRLHRDFGPRLFVGDPGAPQPPIVVGKWNYNPLAGKFTR